MTTEFATGKAYLSEVITLFKVEDDIQSLREDFEKLCEFIEKAKFDKLGAFSYSKEEGTRSYSFTNQVLSREKERRYKQIMKAQAQISYELNQKRLGQVIKVMITAYDETDMSYTGICDLFAPDDIDGRCYIYSSAPLEIGDVVEARIVNAGIYDIDCEVIEQ